MKILKGRIKGGVEDKRREGVVGGKKAKKVKVDLAEVRSCKRTNAVRESTDVENVSDSNFSRSLAGAGTERVR